MGEMPVIVMASHAARLAGRQIGRQVSVRIEVSWQLFDFSQ